MTTLEPGAAPNLIERAKNIILTPNTEWDRIKGETTPMPQLIMGYALPLIALAAVCAFVGMAFIGIQVPFAGSIRVPMTTALGTAVVQIVLGVAWVWALGLIINAIAPSFGSTQDQGQANKVAVYSSTAGWLAGVFAIFPPIAMLGIVGLYSLFLLWLGLPKLMNTPEDKKVGYFASVLVIAILGAIVIGIAASGVQGAMGMGAAMRGGAF